MSPKTGKLAANLALMAVALFAAAAAWRFGLWRGDTPGPGFFPFAVSIALLGLCAVALVVDLAEKPRVREQREEKEPTTWGKFACYLGALAFAALALESLGYQLTITAVFVFILKVAEGLSWTRTLIVTAATLAVCEILFVHALGVDLPSGVFG